MKRIVLTLAVLLIGLAPLAATSHFLSPGANVNADIDETPYSNTSLAFVYTFNAGQGLGFHLQVSPYVLLLESANGSSELYMSQGLVGLGFNTIIGLGGDINFGRAGFLLGGGLYGSIFYDVAMDSTEMFYQVNGGVGGDLTFYVHFTEGRRFLMNIGVSAAWCPWYSYGIYDVYGSELTGAGYDPNQMHFKAYIGLGFRS